MRVLRRREWIHAAAALECVQDGVPRKGPGARRRVRAGHGDDARAQAADRGAEARHRLQEGRVHDRNGHARRQRVRAVVGDGGSTTAGRARHAAQGPVGLLSQEHRPAAVHVQRQARRAGALGTQGDGALRVRGAQFAAGAGEREALHRDGDGHRREPRAVSVCLSAAADARGPHRAPAAQLRAQRGAAAHPRHGARRLPLELQVQARARDGGAQGLGRHLRRHVRHQLRGQRP